MNRRSDTDQEFNEGDEPGQEARAPGTDGAEPAGDGEAADQPVGERRISAQEFDKVVRERDEYLDLARRARADYNNLHRRAEAQAAAIRVEAEQRFALDMIAILDDLERGLEHTKKGQDVQSVVKGIMLVRENFLSALGGYGITPIEADGAVFDHNVHHAIAEQPTDEVEPGRIVAVAQRGYLANGKLLRPAQVVVACATESSTNRDKQNDLEPPDEDTGE